MDGAEAIDDDALNLPPVDEDSGSAYEEQSSDATLSSSHDERVYVSRPPSTTPRRERGRSRSSRPIEGSSRHQENSSPETTESRHATSSQRAVSSNGPQSVSIVKSPSRASAGNTKRKAVRPASQKGAKRFKGSYNDDYRQLLNSVVHETILGVIPQEYPAIPGSQIGSSIWTEEEKELFFSALSRLGRHDSQGLALRVGTKSQLEVQEYIQLLHQGLKDRPDLRQFDFTELQAAFEIGEECDDLLERAGDAVASRQELSEVKNEKDNHGGLWLLTPDIAADLERQLKNHGRQGIVERLPAADLLHVKTWLELPQKIFMNSGDLEGDNNWHSLVELGEAPSIRRTAFEDFHTLAVSITKRLVSAATFCAMSRRRATHAVGTKHAEVLTDDVEAAIKIVGLAENSLDFWVGSARRHSLNVFDEGNSKSGAYLTYDEIEASLKQTRRRSRSRSRSISRQPQSRKPTASVDADTDRDVAAESTAESLDTDEHSHDDEIYPLSSSGPEHDELTDFSDGTGRQTRAELAQARRIDELNNARRAQDAYLEAYDNEASQAEENRLRKLLRHGSPLDIKSEALDAPDWLKQVRVGLGESDWRENFEYWSPWETLETPVPEESFAENRKQMLRKDRRRVREEGAGHDLSNDEETSADETDVEEMDAIPSVEHEDTMSVEPADVQMGDEANDDLYSVSQGEGSPRVDNDVYSSGLPQRTRALSEEDVALGSGYDD